MKCEILVIIRESNKLTWVKLREAYFGYSKTLENQKWKVFVLPDRLLGFFANGNINAK